MKLDETDVAKLMKMMLDFREASYADETTKAIRQVFKDTNKQFKIIHIKYIRSTSRGNR